MEFMQAVFDYAIIVATCTYYFTSSQDTKGEFSLMHGLGWAFRYNAGSLAFGAFLLAVVWTIKLIFEFINNRIKKMNADNGAVKCVMATCRCCLDCFHRFIKFLNENAYIQVALTGKSFCSSALSAFLLALKNAGAFAVTGGIGRLLSFGGKMFITILNTGIGYSVINLIPKFQEDID